jgi:hypothetical protein
MRLDLLHRGEWIAMGGGLLLLIGLFLPSYATDDGNPNSQIDGASGSFSYFEAHTITGWLLLLAALAPFILAWIIVRENELSWPRGQMTMVVAVAAFGFIMYFAFVDRPGSPGGTISLEIGFVFMLIGVLMMLGGSIYRSQGEDPAARKPPGVI